LKEKFSTSLISIIILNYDGGKHLLECVDSVFKTSGCEFELILIDNGSTDNSHIICKEQHPEVILIKNNENIGLAARNIGLNKAKGDFVVFLDSDTVVEPNWLTTLLISYKQNKDGLYQPKILEKERPDFINSAGNMINIFGLAYSRGKGEKDTGQYQNFQRISYTSGACTFTSSEIIQKIGKIDSMFFAYHDDVDYGWRGALLNIPSYYEPRVTIFHRGSPTLKWNPKKFFLLERNRWICLLTLYTRKTLAKIFPLLIIVEIGMLFFFIKKKMFLMKLKSLCSLIKLNSKINRKRKQIKETRKLSDKIVIKNFVNDFYLPEIIHKKEESIKVNRPFQKLNNIARKIIGE